ncbi:MAG: o-succinylbenzoate--CoA ligase [bacterium]|nr:o-succinylbenzoate--CoA ligase [bacterium]
MKNLSPDNFLLHKQNSNAKAIITSSINYTFAELREKVFQRASILRAQNITSGNSVGILERNDLDFVISVFALWQLSAVPVSINTKLNASDIEEQLALSDCDSIIVSEEFSELVKNKKRNLISSNAVKAELHTEYKAEVNLSDPAVIIFTSGSTNKSKGIVLSFGSLYNSALNSNQLLRYTHSDRWLASLPFYHIGGFSTITRSLVFGIPLVIPDSLSTEHLVDSMNKFHPTFISLVSAQLKKIVDERITPNPEVKNCLIGGGFSDIKLIKEANELGWPVNLVYGSTETSSFVTALLKDEILIKPNSVGRAVPTNKIKIVDNDRNELKPFEIGEVAVQTNALMKGYLNPEETSLVVRDGFYHTGDIGYLDEDGYLFLEGRKNYLISSGGENVNPVEIENVLLKHPDISEAAVFPIKDEKWGEIIAAAVVLKKSAPDLSFEDIRLFLQENLAAFKIPKKFFFEEQLPKTELGKVQKEKLIDRYRLTSL